jgi:phage-related protein
MVRRADEPRPLVWRGASKTDFMAFPPDRAARDGLGAVFGADGRTPFNHGQDAWRLRRSNRDRGRESHDGNAYRAVYTVRYAEAVYVLHAFQKKSKKGVSTPKAEIDLIEKRLKDLIKEKEGRQ